MEDFLKRLRGHIFAFVAVVLLIASAPLISIALTIMPVADPRYGEWAIGWFLVVCPFCCGIWYMFIATMTRSARAKLEGVTVRNGFFWAGGRFFGGWLLSQAVVFGFVLSFSAEFGAADGSRTMATERMRIALPVFLFAVWAPVIINLLRHFVRKPRREEAQALAKRKAWEEKEAAWKRREAVWMSRLGHVPVAAYSSQYQPDSVFDIEEEIKKYDLRPIETEYERERESIIREYKELVERFAKLFSDGSSAWDEIMRTANALNGTSNSRPFRADVEIYTTQVIKAFSVANGSTPDGLGRMLLLTVGQWGELGRSQQKPWTVAKFVAESIRCIEKVDHTPPDVPYVVMALSAFDKLRKTHLAADAADAYYSLVIRASECCPASMPVDVLRTRYFTLLQPYISADFNHDLHSSSGKFNRNCTECKQYYAVLRIPEDASKEAIKNAYRNFVKIYHPDRFEGKSERQTAEGEMKQLNVAYKHIMEHFECVKV